MKQLSLTILLIGMGLTFGPAHAKARRSRVQLSVSPFFVSVGSVAPRSYRSHARAHRRNLRSLNNDCYNYGRNRRIRPSYRGYRGVRRLGPKRRQVAFSARF